MINIYSEDEIAKIKASGHITYMTHQHMKDFIKPGVSTKFLDEEAGRFIESMGGIPASKGFEGYPGNICVSVNDEVVHGIGSEDRILKEGDIVTLDIVTCYQGYHSDSAVTHAVGKINKEKEHLLTHTEKSLYVGLKEIKDGAKLGSVGARIQQYAERHGLGVVRELVGHGVGHEMHESPDVPNYGVYNTGITLKAGMVIAVEPMLTAGKRYVAMLDDDWTIVTEDGRPSAHFEHTVAVTKDGYEILTGE